MRLVLFLLILLSSSFAAKKVDTLSFWAMDNGPGSAAVLQEMLTRFEVETSIPVVFKELKWESAFDEIQKAFSEGTAPDVLQVGSSWISIFAGKGYLDGMQSFLNEIDSSRFFDEMSKFSSIEGDSNYYAVPWFLDVRAFFGNKAVLDSLGIRDAHMKSFTRARGVMKAIAQNGLKNAEGKEIVPFGLPGKDDWTAPQVIAPWIWSYGGDFLVKQDSLWKSALLDSNTLNGLFHYLTLLKDTTCVPNALFENSVENATRFTNSEQAFLMGTSEIIRKMDVSVEEGGLKEKSISQDGLVLIPMPFGPKGQFTFVGGSHLAISKNAKKDTKKLLQFLVRVDHIDTYTRRIGFLPSDKSVISVWAQDPRYNALIEDLSHGRSFPNLSQWGEIETILINMSNDIGSIYRTAIENEDRTAEVASIIVRADEKIQNLLSTDSLDSLSSIDSTNSSIRNTDSLLTWVMKILSQKEKEEDFLTVKWFPKGFIIPLPGESWTFRFAIIIGIGVICLFIFFVESKYHLIRRKKKK
ncbi:MAG TPA: extracellular solute-binding protein [Fibrobacteraceae bacterium]|jgi:multiple sugar transport system substrate-binding protein|nr:extracellular solute-binding protein [Fibrobacteraceae bacterium]